MKMAVEIRHVCVPLCECLQKIEVRAWQQLHSRGEPAEQAILRSLVFLTETGGGVEKACVNDGEPLVVGFIGR